MIAKNRAIRLWCKALTGWVEIEKENAFYIYGDGGRQPITGGILGVCKEIQTQKAVFKK